MVRVQILDQAMRCVAVAVAMANHDDASTGSQRRRNAHIKARIFRCALAALTILILVLKVMQEVMRVVRFDFPSGSIMRIRADVINFRLVVIHD